MKEKPLMSTRRINVVERAVEAIDARNEGKQELAFGVRDFVICGLPYKRQKESTFERRNGHHVLRLVSDPVFGLPFGQDRLISVWLATAFQAQGKPADNTIRFRSVSDILRAFGIPIDGREMSRLRQRIERVFGTTYFAYDERRGREGMLAGKYSLISVVDIWFQDRGPLNQHTLWQNRIVLEAKFADDLRRSAVPIDFQSIRTLKDKPMALDLYHWQAWRSWRLAAQGKAEQPISLFGEGGLLAQIGSSVANIRKARQLLKRAQRYVQFVWPECPNEIKENTFLLRPGRAVARHAPICLPGVTGMPDILPSPERVPDLLLRHPEEAD